MTYPRGVRPLLAIALLLAACGGGKAGGTVPQPEPSPRPVPGPDPATTMRDPPEIPCTGPRPAPDYVCVENCGPPVSSVNDPHPGWSWLSPAQAESRRLHGCPICLPESARIATPVGDRPVSSLRRGDPIWSRDHDGRRIAAHVRAVASTPVAPGHRLVRVRLADGRVVEASPLHPLAAGAAIGELRVGATLDGVLVEQVELVPHRGERTWDVLATGPTGDYWADGVLLGSTLRRD